MSDYEIDEIRRIRHQIAAEQGYDVKKLANYYCQVEQILRISGKYRFIDTKRDSVEQKYIKKTASS